MTTHLRVILQEMCKWVGADFEKIDFSASAWYLQYQWTKEEEKAFKAWMFTYLWDNLDARKEICQSPLKREYYIKRYVDMFVLQYGWKVKNEI